MFEWIVEVRRGCGYRHEGGTYLKTAEGSSDGVVASFSVIEPPIPVQRKPYRGAIQVVKENVLMRQPEETWTVGSSAKTTEKRQAQEVWEDIFGMPIYRRMDTGDCVGSESAEDAYNRLLSVANYNSQTEVSLRGLAYSKFQDQPNMAGLYSQLTTTLMHYGVTRDANNLVKAGALAWKMFYQLPPSKRAQSLPLAKLLASLGFVKDGRELVSMIYNK